MIAKIIKISITESLNNHVLTAIMALETNGEMDAMNNLLIYTGVAISMTTILIHSKCAVRVRKGS